MMNVDHIFPLKNRQFTNEYGNVECVLFADSDDIVLSGDNQFSPKRILSREKLNEQLRSQKLFSRQISLASHTALEPYQIQQRDERLKFINVLKKLVDEGFKASSQETYDALKERVVECHPECGGNNFPGKSTICKWWKTWVDASFDNDALCGVKRSRSNKLTYATETHLEHYVATIFFDSSSNIIKNHYNAYHADAIEAGKTNASIVPASERTFYRRLKELSTFEMLLKTPDLPAKVRNKVLLTFKQKIRTTSPLERVEADRMVANMYLRDDVTGQPVGPISLYFAIDVHTRAILSAIMTFGPEKSEDVLNLLRHCVIPDVNNACKGLPKVFIFDNGTGYNNELIVKTAKQLGSQTTFAPAYAPQKKPYVESLNDIVRTEFFQGCKVTYSDGKMTVGFNSYKTKRLQSDGDDSFELESLADVYVSDFKEALPKFIFYYNNTPKDALNGDTPAEVFKREIEERPDLICLDYESVSQAFHVKRGKHKTTINHNGTVRCNNMDFYDIELKKFYLEHTSFIGKKQPLTCDVHYDPFDCRWVTAVVSDGYKSREMVLTNTRPEISESSMPISFYEALGKAQNSIPILSHNKFEIDSPEFGNSITLSSPFRAQKPKKKPPKRRKNERPLVDAMPEFYSEGAKKFVNESMAARNDDDAQSITQQSIQDDKPNKLKEVPPSKFEADDEPDLF